MQETGKSRATSTAVIHRSSREKRARLLQKMHLDEEPKVKGKDQMIERAEASAEDRGNATEGVPPSAGDRNGGHSRLSRERSSKEFVGKEGAKKGIEPYGNETSERTTGRTARIEAGTKTRGGRVSLNKHGGGSRVAQSRKRTSSESRR